MESCGANRVDRERLGNCTGTPMMAQRSYATGTMGDVGYIEVISRVPVPEGARVGDTIRIGAEVSRLARHLYTIIYEGM